MYIQVLNLALAAYQSRQFWSPTSAKARHEGLTPKPKTVTWNFFTTLAHLLFQSPSTPSTMASFAVKSIDHVVLTVKNIPATINFYTTRLGMKHEVFTSKGVER